MVCQTPSSPGRVAVTWDAGEVRLVGRSEYFTRRFDRELDAIHGTLTRPAGTASIDAAATDDVREA